VSSDLVIFDCDGVLVDSEPIANRILTEMLNEAGLAIEFEETFETFVGRSMSNCLAIIEQRLGRPVPDEFVGEYNARSFRAFERELRPVPGVVEALNRIDVPVCVASSASHEKMRTTLGVTGLLARFEGKMFSATEVGRGKPDPALFLHAARCMGGSPRNSVVVEDTVVGVRAGRAAEMAVFGYAGAPSRVAALEQAGARVFGQMSELPAMISGPW